MNVSCEDINVHEKWCSCHVLYEVDSTRSAAKVVPIFCLSELNKSISGSEIRTVLRHHWYRHEYDIDVTYYWIVIPKVPNENVYDMGTTYL